MKNFVFAFLFVITIGLCLGHCDECQGHTQEECMKICTCAWCEFTNTTSAFSPSATSEARSNKCVKSKSTLTCEESSRDVVLSYAKDTKMCQDGQKNTTIFFFTFVFAPIIGVILIVLLVVAYKRFRSYITRRYPYLS